MNQMDTNVVFLVQMLGEVFGTIDGTVLPACTTEGYLEIGEVPLDEPLHMMVHEGIDGVEEGEDLTVLLEEVDDGLVKTREGLVGVVLTRVMGSPAIEDISASVAGRILRNPLFKGERVDRY